MARPFLTARWANLAIVTYAVPPGLLAPRLPRGAGLVLDERGDLEARGGAPGHTALVSLVAFEFLSTRVLGVRWPTFVNFPEINLRFYVRRGAQRGVIFLREIVPKGVISAVARRLYNEPYATAPIAAYVSQTDRTVEAEYRLTWPARPASGPAPQHTVRLVGSKPSIRPEPDTFDHWLKEHQFGFTPRPAGRGRPAGDGVWAYEVVHPVWSTYPVAEAQVDFDFGGVFGPDWGFLSQARPVSTVLAAGSEVAVYFRRHEGRPEGVAVTTDRSPRA